MGFQTNTSHQISLNDRANHLTSREQKFLNKSWAKPFGDEIFPMIDESKFSVLYCEDNGRPNTPVNIIIGALFLKEMLSLTDEELFESILFDIRFQYALHLTSCEDIPFSDRTVSRFRERLYEYELDTDKDLMKDEIERLSCEFAKRLNISSNTKRMDSVMVSSSCKNMGRLELIYTCVSNLVKALIKSGETVTLPEHILKYGEESNKNAFCYRLNKEEIGVRLNTVTADALLVYELASSLQGGADEFQLLERLLGDQTKNGELKPNKEISPESLQNPSDEDATFRRKAGKEHQGYVANVVEDCGEKVNIITQYDYDVNLHSDTAFASETIEQLGKQEEKTLLISDGAYSSEANFEAAKENNIELVTTNLTGKMPPEIITEFEIEDYIIQACPAGNAPIDSTYDDKKDEYRAHFNAKACETCPRKAECVATKKSNGLMVVKLTATTIKRAEYAKKLSTDKYKEHSRKRNGVEGMPSVLRRRYRVDYMPIRGLVRSKMWFGFKIAAINIKRVIVAALFLQLFYKLSIIFENKNSFRTYSFSLSPIVL